VAPVVRHEQGGQCLSDPLFSGRAVPGRGGGTRRVPAILISLRSWCRVGSIPGPPRHRSVLSRFAGWTTICGWRRRRIDGITSAKDFQQLAQGRGRKEGRLRCLRALCLLAAVGRRDLVQNVLPSLRGSPLGKVRLATNFWPQGEGGKAPSWDTERVLLGAGRVSLTIATPAPRAAIGEGSAGRELALGARLQECQAVFTHGA
jgi:hypothetical protein